MELDVPNNVSDEEYVIQKAKSALKHDQLAAKAWMITAKTLYPNNFGVQFEAYDIEKTAGHVKEAAKCFSELFRIGKFQQQPEFWKEIDSVTTALKSDTDLTDDSEKAFLCEMFKHIPADIQHKLLLLTAEHCEDTMEHCKLLLLLLQKFPSAIYSHGVKLVDTLLSAEKHCPASNMLVNSFRKLLVCDLLPLLSSEQATCELPPKLLYKLLHKTIEYYLYTFSSKCNEKSEQPWIKLFGVLDFVGRQLGWEPYLTNIGVNWTKESYWQKLMTFCQSPTMLDMDPNNSKQLLYCLTIFFVNCLHDYTHSLNLPTNLGPQQQNAYILVEAFVDPNYPNPNEIKTKRRKGDPESSIPHISVDNPDNKSIKNLFVMAVNCWDFLTATEHLHREFVKLSGHLKLDHWLFPFLIDYAIYKGRYDDALSRLLQITEPHMDTVKNLKMANVYFLKKNYRMCLDHVFHVVPSHPSGKGSSLTSLVIGGNQRHVTFMPVNESTILQYCVKMLIRAIQDNMRKQQQFDDLSVGNLLVLVQLDWPQEEDIVPVLMKQIQLKGSFQYYLFQNYITNVDVLEELTYLWTAQGGQITLEIVPHLGRRIGTRGSDKGVKEEIKQTIRRQVARCNEPINQLISTFLQQERVYLHQSLD